MLVGLLAIVLIAAVSNVKPNPNPSASTNATVNVIASTRSITVSPGEVTFKHCAGGTNDNLSTSTRLGWPHGTCSVGRVQHKGNLPITIKNTGIDAQIQVSASDASPSGSGPKWQLCGGQGDPACTSDSQPGANQFEAWTTAKGLNRINLTSQALCDRDFSSDGCSALRGQSAKEGLDLLGPLIFNSTSTSYTITVTWYAAPPS